MRKKIVGFAVAVLLLAGFGLLSLVALSDPQSVQAADGLKYVSIALVGLGIASVWGPLGDHMKALDYDRLPSDRSKAFESLKSRAKKLVESGATVQTAFVMLLARLVVAVGLIGTGAVWFAVLVTFVAVVRYGTSKLLIHVSSDEVNLDNLNKS